MKDDRTFNLKIITAGDFLRYKAYDKPLTIPSNFGNRGERGKSKNPEKSLRESVSRARQKIHGYIMANYWEYWATQTFNGQVINRYDLDDIVKRYGQKLRDLKRRKYPTLQWLIVPEQHKDKAWHFHMFMSGIPSDRVVYSGRDYYNKKGQFVRRIYNWLDTIDYGFNDYIHIGDCEPLERFKMANYVMKYITKDLAKARFNKKMYWSSRGLESPAVTNTFTYNLERSMSSTGIIITENSYYIKDVETGEIFNKVRDVTMYDPLPF